MEAVLVMFRSDGERRSFPVSRDVTVIGRREDCDLRIPLGDISRKHCRLLRDGDELKLEDLGSSNGTFHNGLRVQEAPLAPGDSIQVGPVVFVLQVDGVPADEELRPVVSDTAEDTAAPATGHLHALEPTAASEAGANDGSGDLADLEPAGALEDDALEILSADPDDDTADLDLDLSADDLSLDADQKPSPPR